MTVPTFAARRKAWSSPPVDDIGYLPSTDLLAMSDEHFKEVMQQMWRNRYWGWRNHRNRWWDLFGLGHNQGRVLDYGCGVGMEGLQFALAGSEVTVADIAAENLYVAERLFDLYGQNKPWKVLLGASPPTPYGFEPMNLIHCVGVLHHIPKPIPLMEMLASWLAPGGRVNLMVYSDRAWLKAVGSYPPDDTVNDPGFQTFWQAWDPIGGYADWYSREKLEDWFGEWFTIRETADLTAGGEYLGAVLEKR